MLTNGTPDGKRLTFAQLCVMEPRLRDLEHAVKALRRQRLPRNFCANTTFERRFVWRIERLVGWEAGGADPMLKTSEAFDTVVGHLYELLPDCRRCLCVDARFYGAKA